MTRIPGRVADRCRRPSPTSPSCAGVSRQTVSNAVNNPDLLRPDTLARVQEAIDELGYSPNRAARNLRTRTSHLIGLRFTPGPGGHRQRADGPLRALAGRDLERGRLPRAAVPGRPRGPARRVRRPAALDRRRRVRRHRHLPRQPAGRLAGGAAGAVRRLRPALGQPGRRATRGSTSTAPPAPSSPPATCSTAGTSGSPGSAGARTRCIGEDRRAGWSRAHARPRPAHHRPRLAGRGHRRQRPRGGGRAARRGPADRRSSAPPTPWPWACCTRWPTAAWSPAATSRSSASTTPRWPRSCRPGLTSVRQPLEEVAVEIVRALEGLLGHPPRSRRCAPAA